MSPGLGGDLQAFSFDDKNQDGVWLMGHAGSNIWSSPDMSPFVTGIIDNNGERIGTADTAQSDFDGLQRMGADQQFVNWMNTSKDTVESDDPGFKGCKKSNTHTNVIPNASNCSQST